MLAGFAMPGAEVQTSCVLWFERLAVDYDEFQVLGVVFLSVLGKMLPSLDYSLSR